MVSTRFLIITLLLISTSGISQSCYSGYDNDVNDGDYIRHNIATKKVIPYPHVNEGDVLWKKRVWRTLDMREKINHPLFYPEEPLSDRASLWDVIKCAALQEKRLTIYELGVDLDDQFRYPVVPLDSNENNSTFNNRLLSFFGENQVIPKYDNEGEFVYDEITGDQLFDTIIEEYLSTDIIRYEIKEDCFFNSKYSRMEARIIGISPVAHYRHPITGDIVGTRNLFWLYFPECRYVFQNQKVYNPFNDAMEMTFDDLFWKRRFSSYISKESNIFDRRIQQYANGKDALIESEKIKLEILNFEQDVWHY